MKNAIERIISLSQQDDVSALVMLAKLTEEVGELAEAVLYDSGYNQHKKMKEPTISEVADVIQVALAVLTKSYPGNTPEMLAKSLSVHLERKTDKWQAILNHQNELTKK